MLGRQFVCQWPKAIEMFDDIILYRQLDEDHLTTVGRQKPVQGVMPLSG